MKSIKLLMLVLFVSLLSACGGSDSGGSAQPESVADVLAPAATWNMEDLEIATNGNLPVAIAALNSGLEKLPAKVAAEIVFKRPWDFYGKEVCFTGLVGIVQDYPPGNEISKLFGGSVSEIVMVDGETVIDGILKGSSGNVSIGDKATICGTPAGHVEVENRLGGKTTQLAVVGVLSQKTSP